MKHFKIEEFACKGCCGKAEMSPKFLAMIDAARELAGIPFHINSGFRCEDKNRAVGSTSTNHVRGVAADIRCTDSQARLEIIKAALAVGFTRIGLAKSFIHLDCNWTGADSVWFY